MFHISRAYTVTSMLTIVNFATKHPAAYLTGCVIVGFTLRFAMAHGNWGLFFNPLYPLFVR